MLHRHPLYLIVRMLCYDDGLGAGKNLLALKTTDQKQEECSIWVYQCSSSVSGTLYIIKELAGFFKGVKYLKDRLEVLKKNLHIYLFLSICVICSLSEQEQAQSICKVLSTSFDCALTSDKS